MKNTFYILLAGCLWGIISIFINRLNDMGFQSIQCVALRTLITALILLVCLLLTDREKLKVHLRDLPFFLGTGIGSIVFFNYCYFRAIQMTGSSSVPALLLYTSPVFVMLLSAVLFRERITASKVTAMAVTFLGLLFVTGAFSDGGGLSAAVLLLGLGAGLGYALYSIFGKFVIKKYDDLTVTFYTFAFAAAGSVPIAALTEPAPKPETAGLLWALCMALFSTVLPFLFYTKGLRGMDAGRAAILAAVEPFVAAAVGVTVFHEAFTIYKLAGMICIIAAIILLNLTGLRGKKAGGREEKKATAEAGKGFSSITEDDRK